MHDLKKRTEQNRTKRNEKYKRFIGSLTIIFP